MVMAATLLANPKRTTVPGIKNKLMIFVLGLMFSTTVCLHNTCELYDFSIPFHGQYCPKEGIIISESQWQQCKLFCLQTSHCQSVNYNFTDNICTYFTVTCRKATSHPGMAFALFTGRQSAECKWIAKWHGHPDRDDRSVTEDNKRFAARMQKKRSDFMGYRYFLVMLRSCSRHKPTINNYGHMPWQPRNWTPTSLVWCRQNKAGRKHCPLPACLAHLFQTILNKLKHAGISTQTKQIT